jgi:hypothetical protein
MTILHYDFHVNHQAAVTLNHQKKLKFNVVLNQC